MRERDLIGWNVNALFLPKYCRLYLYDFASTMLSYIVGLSFCAYICNMFDCVILISAYLRPSLSNGISGIPSYPQGERLQAIGLLVVVMCTKNAVTNVGFEKGFTKKQVLLGILKQQKSATNYVFSPPFLPRKLDGNGDGLISQEVVFGDDLGSDGFFGGENLATKGIP